VLAINLAQKLGVDPSQQNVIYRKYGDYLYQKQDYDTAMQQYLKAIDNTEPSQVIRKVCPCPVQLFVLLLMHLSSLTRNESTTSSTT
jgi:tetratricopeptide (TPR) repeat protein